MKKNYSKKQLAQQIISANPDIFIPIDILIDDLDSIYKIRKIAVKILADQNYCPLLLNNLYKIADNAFGDKKEILFEIVLSDEEYSAVKAILDYPKT